MKKIITLIVATFSLVALVACSTSESKEKKVNLPKIEGYTYYGDIPQEPERVVSLSSSYTGYLYQLNLPIVGVTSYDIKNPVLDDYTKDAKEVMPDDLEAIAELEPDLIVVGSSEEKIEQLAEIAPVIAIDYGASDYLQTLTDFGQIFNKEEQARNWLTSWEEKTAQASKELKEAIGEDTTFTVMGLYEKEIYLFGDNWGRGGEVIYQALGFNAPDKVLKDVFETGYLSISQEVVADYAGDYIVIAAEDDTTGSSLYESDVWKSIQAVKDGHVIRVDANAFYFNDPLTLEHELDTLKEELLKIAK